MEKTIPYDLKKSGYRICQVLKQERKDHRNYLILKNIKSFRKHLTSLKLRKDDKTIDTSLLVAININIAKINTKYEASIPYFNNPISDNWLSECKKWFKIINDKWKSITKITRSLKKR